MVNDEQSKHLQHYLTALATYLEASAKSTDPEVIEELREEVEKALGPLEHE